MNHTITKYTAQVCKQNVWLLDPVDGYVWKWSFLVKSDDTDVGVWCKCGLKATGV